MVADPVVGAADVFEAEVAEPTPAVIGTAVIMETPAAVAVVVVGASVPFEGVVVTFWVVVVAFRTAAAYHDGRSTVVDPTSV